MLCLKFAKKSLKIENFGHLFPKNTKENERGTRKGEFYKVSRIYGTRYLKSAIPSMQGLNRDRRYQQENMKKLNKHFPNILIFKQFLMIQYDLDYSPLAPVNCWMCIL